jgi:hypothetical protein
MSRKNYLEREQKSAEMINKKYDKFKKSRPRLTDEDMLYMVMQDNSSANYSYLDEDL